MFAFSNGDNLHHYIEERRTVLREANKLKLQEQTIQTTNPGNLQRGHVAESPTLLPAPPPPLDAPSFPFPQRRGAQTSWLSQYLQEDSQMGWSKVITAVRTSAPPVGSGAGGSDGGKGAEQQQSDSQNTAKHPELPEQEENTSNNTSRCRRCRCKRGRSSSSRRSSRHSSRSGRRARRTYVPTKRTTGAVAAGRRGKEARTTTPAVSSTSPPVGLNKSLNSVYPSIA
jgi:hypothetical protein